MSDLLQTGVAKALSLIQSHASQSVDYEAEHGSVEGILATLGETEVEEMTDIAVIQGKRRDYILQASDLVISGEKFEPTEGDRIIEGNLKCRVVAIGDMACFNYLDPYRTMIRVHTVVEGVTSW